MEQKEIWKPVVGYEKLYEVSNLGNVKKTIPKRYCVKEASRYLMYKRKNAHGYYTVRFCKNGKLKTFLIHRLVALSFIPNPENKPHIDHINTIRTDNRVENLRWATQEENANNPLTVERIRATTTGTSNPFYGKRHSENTRRKLSDARMGTKMSERTKAKLKIAFSGKKNPMYGKTHTEDSMRKIMKAVEKQMTPVLQFSMDRKFIKEYRCLNDAARSINSSLGNLWVVCHKNKDISDASKWYSCHGYKWIKKEDYDNRNSGKKENHAPKE